MQRVRGSKSYRALPQGLRELGGSSAAGDACLSVAVVMAGNAQAVGDSTYEAASVPVRAGWNNESRSGAVVREVEPHWRDSRDEILLRVAEQMRVRNPSD